jgi:hypothetical protein
MSTLTRLAVVAASTVTVAAVALVWLDRSHDRGQLTTADVSTAAGTNALREAANLRVFFAHQSVGGNIVGGLPAAYEGSGIPAPPVVELSDVATLPPELKTGDRGVFTHVVIGENGDPIGKIRDFDTWIRSGLGERIDVAFLKLCYIDFDAGTDVDEVFETYRKTFDALERDFPEVTFVAVTTPLTTQPALRTRIKGLLGGSNQAPADNATRQRFNTLLRTSYGDRVFDLAAFESTAPDGSRVSGTSQGEPYFALYDGYAADEGHLTPLTSEVMAARLMGFLAERAG